MQLKQNKNKKTYLKSVSIYTHMGTRISIHIYCLTACRIIRTESGYSLCVCWYCGSCWAHCSAFDCEDAQLYLSPWSAPQPRSPPGSTWPHRCSWPTAGRPWAPRRSVRWACRPPAWGLLHPASTSHMAWESPQPHTWYWHCRLAWSHCLWVEWRIVVAPGGLKKTKGGVKTQKPWQKMELNPFLYIYIYIYIYINSVFFSNVAKRKLTFKH